MTIRATGGKAIRDRGGGGGPPSSPNMAAVASESRRDLAPAVVDADVAGAAAAVLSGT